MSLQHTSLRPFKYRSPIFWLAAFYPNHVSISCLYTLSCISSSKPLFWWPNNTLQCEQIMYVYHSITVSSINDDSEEYLHLEHAVFRKVWYLLCWGKRKKSLWLWGWWHLGLSILSPCCCILLQPCLFTSTSPKYLSEVKFITTFIRTEWTDDRRGIAVTAQRICGGNWSMGLLSVT